jgi:myo-inositol-1(or 4)-monophosphatase
MPIFHPFFVTPRIRRARHIVVAGALHTMQPMLNVAVRAAREAGKIINRASLDIDLLRVARKAANDFVTEVDRAAEQAIIETLLKAYPQHGILAEETGTAHGRPDSEFQWIIDPLDGTTNFIHGMPVYAVSIALAHRGVIQQAVVYDPTRDELFTASRGAGAFLNSRRIRVSNRVRLEDSLIGTGFPFRESDDFDTYMAMFKRVAQRCVGLRRPGAAAIDLAYVAAGRYDAFFEAGLKPWDVAAGSLLITEAGGLVGNFSGDADYLHSGEMVGGTPRVFAQLVGLLQPLARAGRTKPEAAPATHGAIDHAAAAQGDKVAAPDAPADRPAGSPPRSTVRRIKSSPASSRPQSEKSDRKPADHPGRRRQSTSK